MSNIGEDLTATSQIDLGRYPIKNCISKARGLWLPANGITSYILIHEIWLTANETISPKHVTVADRLEIARRSVVSWNCLDGANNGV